MNEGMDEEQDDWLDRYDGVTLRTIFVAFMLAAVLYPLAWAFEPRLQPPLWLAVAVLTADARWFIWRVVRWFNNRDDPRHQKRPPDAP